MKLKSKSAPPLHPLTPTPPSHPINPNRRPPSTPPLRVAFSRSRASPATVEKTREGFKVTVRDFPYARDASSGWRVEALIGTDPSGKMRSQELAWDRGRSEEH